MKKKDKLLYLVMCYLVIKLARIYVLRRDKNLTLRHSYNEEADQPEKQRSMFSVLEICFKKLEYMQS